MFRVGVVFVLFVNVLVLKLLSETQVVSRAADKAPIFYRS